MSTTSMAVTMAVPMEKNQAKHIYEQAGYPDNKDKYWVIYDLGLCNALQRFNQNGKAQRN